MSWWIDESCYPGPAISESELQLVGERWHYPGIMEVPMRDVRLSPRTSHPNGATVYCARGSVTTFVTFNDVDGVREYTEHRFFYHA